MNTLQAKIEQATGVIWGTYRVPEQSDHAGQALRRALFYVMVHPKGSALVRLEIGVRGRAFYLHRGA